MKSILVRLAVPVTLLALSGCAPTDTAGNDDTGGQKFGALSLFDPAPSPGNSTIVPFPFDGLFSGFRDPTLNIPNGPNDDVVSFVTAANKVDGFSTTASLFTDLTGFVDYSTAADALLVYKCTAYSTSGPTTGACINATRLTAGVDYLVQSSPAIDGTVPKIAINQKRSRLLIEPLHPLAPSTRYFVAVTSDLKSLDGIPSRASDIYRVTASATPVSQQTAPVLGALSSQQKAILETLRSQLVRPAVQLLTALSGRTEDELILTWSFTTESTGKTLTALNNAAVARPIGVVSTGFKSDQLGAPAGADVWAGTFTTPYYLTAAASNHDPSPLATFFAADPAQPDLSAKFLSQVPCGAFATGATLPGGTAQPSASTTICYPMPVKKSDATIPVLVTVPNADAGSAATKPTNGFPVVIFQHGITGNRSQMLAIGPTLAKAGFVTVAIDLPLHGIVPTDPAAALRINGVSERTYDLDLANNTTGAPGPDGVVDSSGSYFINLTSLLTSRDNIRQAVSDLINLSKSVGQLNVDGTAGADIDTSRIYFVGHSLGGIVGTTLLGVNTDIKAATLAMPGGGLGKLLDASKAFGPRIAAGLHAAGVDEGTDNYETFIRFAQLAVDPGDPINFAADANANHAIHMIEVINDLVVPNAANAGPASSTQDLVTITGYLSGTNPLYQEMGLTVRGPITPPGTASSGAPDTVVQFAVGDHGSILSPAASAAATCEMQRETAQFLATNGAGFQLGGACP